MSQQPQPESPQLASSAIEVVDHQIHLVWSFLVCICQQTNIPKTNLAFCGDAGEKGEGRLEEGRVVPPEVQLSEKGGTQEHLIMCELFVQTLQIVFFSSSQTFISYVSSLQLNKLFGIKQQETDFVI